MNSRRLWNSHQRHKFLRAEIYRFGNSISRGFQLEKFLTADAKTRNNAVEMVRGLVRLVRPCSMYVGIFFRSQYSQYAWYSHDLMYVGIFPVLVRQYAQCGHVLMYVGIFSVLVRQYAQYGHVLMYVGIFSVLVRQYAQYGHDLCMLVFYPVLLRPCFYVCWYLDLP